MQIKKNISLEDLNTFRINVKTKEFCIAENEKDIIDLFETGAFDRKFLILGCGADLLFTGDFDGLIIKSGICGIKIVSENETSAVIEAGSGVIWDELVGFALKNKLYGLENTAKIPSTVGAAPVQNIGAYGVEQKDTFLSLRAIRLTDGKETEFCKNDCCFAYRSSFFKSETEAVGKNTYFIISVRYRLSKIPAVNVEYAGLQKYLSEKKINNPLPSDVYDAVTAIRAEKLPDPAVSGCGNAGSFFKNPVVSDNKFETLLKEYPDIPHYRIAGAGVKIPAAWLIEKSGMKNEHEGDAGISPRHALILQNFGNASGGEVFTLSEKIMQKVYDCFGVQLTREVIVIR